MVYRRAKKRSFVKFLFILLILIAAGTAYFIIDQFLVYNEIISLDTIEYTAYTAEKSEQKAADGIPLSAHTIDALKGDVYHTPLGFSIVSYSEKWTGDKLIDIYLELLNNTHGDEIMSISKVIIYPGESEIDVTDHIIAGSHTIKRKDSSVFFNLPSIVPKSMRYSIHSTLSIIELFNMDAYDNVQQASKTIAHEYGHHYSMYYFMQDDKAAKESDYYRLRNFSSFDHEVFFDDQNTYFQNHEWSIYEIAAEDYVQLLGSPNAKQPKVYFDVYDVLLSNDDKYYPRGDETTVNVFPQENIYIPLADEVAGLRDYFNSFIDKENPYQPLEKADFGLAIKEYSNHGYTYYDITWEKTSTASKALYTLVCYDTKGNILMPVKTVFGDAIPIARVGTVSRLEGNTLTTCTNEITEDDRYFKLYLLLPDGRMQSSELFYADFL
ncbi:MAG: hypothetical protein ACOX8Q_04510 [Christensenellales bacterium]|jgi:hypothetical protein